jgi:hypothetical protein
LKETAMSIAKNSTAESASVSDKIPCRSDPYPVDAVDSLLAALPGQGVYALLDMAFKPSLNDELRHRFPALKLHCLFGDIYSGVGLMDIAPWLMPLPDEAASRRTLVDYLLLHTCGTPMLSFIASQHTSLIKHLQQQLDAENPQGEGFIMRLADSHALDSLLKVLTAEQRQRLLLPDMQWWYWQMNGELTQVTGGEAIDTAPRNTGPYHFSAAQLAQITAQSQAGKWLHVIEHHQQHFGQLTGLPSQVIACLQTVLNNETEKQQDAVRLRVFKAALIKEGLLAVMGSEDDAHK